MRTRWLERSRSSKRTKEDTQLDHALEAALAGSSGPGLESAPSHVFDDENDGEQDEGLFAQVDLPDDLQDEIELEGADAELRPEDVPSMRVVDATPQQSAVPATPNMGAGAETFDGFEVLQDVKPEVAWPSRIDGVIDLEFLEENDDLLTEGNQSSSTDGSSSTDLSSDSDVEVDDDAAKTSAPSPLTDMFVNVSSMVIHQRKHAGIFKCGRKITQSYVPVWEPHGLRCGNCFPE
eukprot:Skav213094  [mRNA]  locus=scaffold512:196014:198202:- [translate_table: standard]